MWKKTLLTSFIICLTVLLVGAQSFDELAKTPPMGWNSWNKFSCYVSEALIKEMAEAMVSSGMRDAGYQYIVIDDCWQVDRDSSGNIIADPKRLEFLKGAIYAYSVLLKGLNDQQQDLFNERLNQLEEIIRGQH